MDENGDANGQHEVANWVGKVKTKIFYEVVGVLSRYSCKWDVG